MEYKAGSQISDRDILKRFKDEDGEIFVEVRGISAYLFRVTEGNRVFYKLDKKMLEGEELTLFEDFSDRTFPIEPELPPAPEILPDIIPDPFRPPEPTLSNKIRPGDSETIKVKSDSLASQSKIKELEEGQQVPPHLIPMCKPNSYGGYSLRFNRFLYILDSRYCVDMKSPDAALSYDFGPDTPGQTPSPQPAPPAPPAFSEPVPPSPTLDTTPQPRPQGPKFKRGHVLPEQYRNMCEQTIGGGGGLRFSLDDYIYMLDDKYTIIATMRVTVMEDAASITSQPAPSQSYSAANGAPTPQQAHHTSPSPPPSTPPTAPKPASMPKPKKKLSKRQAVDNVVVSFQEGLKMFNVSADFFKDSVLAPSNRHILVRAFNGDISELNDDTKEATTQGIKTILPDGGFSFYKSALVHELYIKSTLSGRGDNMKYLLTHIVCTGPDGTIRDINTGISVAEQSEMVSFIGSRAKVYLDKKDMIKRVHRHLVSNVFQEFAQMQQGDKKLLFNAYLIMKLYQQTTRLDRGNGITMIRLSRDLMTYKKQ